MPFSSKKNGVIAIHDATLVRANGWRDGRRLRRPAQGRDRPQRVADPRCRTGFQQDCWAQSPWSGNLLVSKKGEGHSRRDLFRHGRRRSAERLGQSARHADAANPAPHLPGPYKADGGAGATRTIPGNTARGERSAGSRAPTAHCNATKIALDTCASDVRSINKEYRQRRRSA